MSDDRLSAGLLAAACLNAAASQAKHALVLRKGDPDAGVLFLKTLARDGSAMLFGQRRDAEGRAAWRRVTGAAPVPEADVDARFAREAEFDPDIWAIELLDDSHLHPLNPRIVD